jgi:hypothetical protein
MKLTGQTVYLDATGKVLATAGERSGYTTPSLAAVQVTHPSVTERITGVELGPNGRAAIRAEGTAAWILTVGNTSQYHKKQGGGDGTSLSHYIEQDSLDEPKRTVDLEVRIKTAELQAGARNDTQFNAHRNDGFGLQTAIDNVLNPTALAVLRAQNAART